MGTAGQLQYSSQTNGFTAVRVPLFCRRLNCFVVMDSSRKFVSRTKD